MVGLWDQCLTAGTGPRYAVIRAESRAGVAEFVAADHRMESDAPGGCIVKH